MEVEKLTSVVKKIPKYNAPIIRTRLRLEGYSSETSCLFSGGTTLAEGSWPCCDWGGDMIRDYRNLSTKREMNRK